MSKTMDYNTRTIKERIAEALEQHKITGECYYMKKEELAPGKENIRCGWDLRLEKYCPGMQIPENPDHHTSCDIANVDEKIINDFIREYLK
ncbi:hypothetical protein KY332_01430 [Candidatus Woesearchaeota archaeon]|nr:hypothetical protein [Candidatus Woesearchaeota archaeon]